MLLQLLKKEPYKNRKSCITQLLQVMEDFTQLLWYI